MERFVGQHSQRVRSGQDAQRPILRGRIVEMNAQGQHLSKGTLGSVSVDHAIFDGPRSPARSSRRSCNGKAVSWCHTTSQFVAGDLSKSVARKGNASVPRVSCAISMSCASRAAAATAGRLIAWRTPALLRGKSTLLNTSSSPSTSFGSKIPGIILVFESAPANSTNFSFEEVRKLSEATGVLLLCGAVGVDGGADDSHFIGGWDDFEAAALQRTHLDHFVQQPVQQGDIDELHVRSGDEEGSGAFHVNAGGGRGGQSTMTKRHKLGAARVARAGVFKNFFRFEIHKTQTHGAASENSFQVSATAATAEIFLGIQSDDGVPAFPDSFARRIAAKAHAIPERPHARQLMQLALRRRDSRGHDVRVIEQANLRTRSFAAQRGGQSRLQRESLGLMEVGRILHDAVANDSWKADSNGFDFFSARDFFHLPANAIHDAFRGHRLQRVERFHFFWENVGRTKNLVAFHQANGDMFHDEYTDCPAHRAPANLRESKMRTRDSLLEPD